MDVKVIGYWGAYPNKGEATSCYLLQQGNFNLVIDLGSGALSRIQQYLSIEQVDAVVLSHFHSDHVADLGVFQYACLVQQQLGKIAGKVPIYAAKDDGQAFQQLNHQATVGKKYDDRKEYQIGPFTFHFLKTKHPKSCYAMRVTDGETTMVYTADTSYFDGLVDFARGADLLIAESSFYKGMDGSKAGHMTSEECGKLAQRANVKQLCLTHLPHFGDHNDLAKQAGEQFNGEIQLAKEGVTYSL
ncbi:MBL fold metallo-hydrolase [Bacillaceae bacterium W0354]